MINCVKYLEIPEEEKLRVIIVMNKFTKIRWRGISAVCMGYVKINCKISRRNPKG